MTRANEEEGEATGNGVPQAGGLAAGDSGRQLIPGQGIYLPAAVAAYQSRPVGASQSTDFDPATMQPRWRAANMALLVLALLLVAGALTPVPVGTPGTIVGAQGSDVVVALSSPEAPGRLTEVDLRLGEARLTGVVMAVDYVDEGPAPVPLVLVEMPGADLVREEDVGSPVVLEVGSRPILVDILRRGQL